MSEAVQLAKAARENLARALTALQGDGVPPEIFDAAEPIAAAMSVLHRIERSNGQDLEGRDNALVSLRSALNKLQMINQSHPSVDMALEAVAASLAKAHALTRLPVAQAAPPAPPQPAFGGTQVIAQQPPAPPPVQQAFQPPQQQQAPQQRAPMGTLQMPPGAGQAVQAAAAQIQAQQAQQAQPYAPPPQAPAQQYAPPQQQYAPPPQAPPQQYAPPPQQPPYGFSPPQGAPQAPPQQHRPTPAPMQAQQPMHNPSLPMHSPSQPQQRASAPQQQHSPSVPQHNMSAPQQHSPSVPQQHNMSAPQQHSPSVPQQQHSPSQAQQPRPSSGGTALDVHLGTNSTSNFYKGLGGNDVIEHGGIFVATYKINPKLGEAIALRVLLPGDYEFQARGVVQWKRENAGSGEGSEPGFGVRFTQISPEGRQLVYRYTRNREPMFYDDL
jgi:hypothetical protein